MPRLPRKGFYKPQNPQKYVGKNLHEIVYRSGYELKFMRECDLNPKFLEWSSESVVIPYRTIFDEALEMKTGLRKWHRYYVDFYVKVLEKTGQVKRYLVEVKPYHQTRPPRKSPRQKTKTAEEAKTTWVKNKAKWKAAEEWCKDHGMEFMLITEKQLYGE